jgi:hypothetical protein
MTLCGAAILLMTQCGRNPGSGTETGNGLVTAMLYNPGGSPAANAKVCFYHRDNDPRPDSGAGVVDSALTDANGNYSVTLEAGPYTIEASSDSGLAFQDSITAIKDDTVRPDPDTLLPAGSIRGVVRLEEGGDPRSVFILFMGTRTFTWPDDSFGNFTSGAMAGGKYRVRIITTTPDYLPLDDTLTVNAGSDDTLADTIVLNYNGIPIPKNVRIVYDTLKQIVNLTWDSASASRVDYYNIYRRNVTADSTPVKINASPVRKNSYRDSTGTQDITYEYRAASVDKAGMEGRKSEIVSVIIASYFVLDTVFGETGTGPGQFDQLNDISIAKNGDIYIADWNNNRIQIFDSTMLYKRQFGNGVLNKPTRVVVDSLGHVFVAVGAYTVSDIIYVFDTTGALGYTITALHQVFDLDAKDSVLCVITNGDSVSIYSYNGSRKRSWKCDDFPSCNNIVAGDSDKIFVSHTILPSSQVVVYDTLGNIRYALTLPAYNYPQSIAIDEQKHRLYTVCSDNFPRNTLHVTDRNNVEIANYRIPTSLPGEPVSVALQHNGSVLLVLGTTNKILKLKTLLP